MKARGWEIKERMGTNRERRWGLMCYLGKRRMRVREGWERYLRRRESRDARGSSKMRLGEEGKWREREIRDWEGKWENMKCFERGD
jgi:hypothetical protein